MRVVFDTYVIISACLWTGEPHRALEIAGQQRLQILISEPMLDELRDVLQRPKFVERLLKINQTPDQVFASYSQMTEMIEPASVGRIEEADPGANMVLACAVGGSAECVVAGDVHLLTLGSYQSIPIWNVSQFLAQVDPTLEA